jgi:hypothetical protein
MSLSSFASQSNKLRSCGLMDKASDFGSGDCRFESCHDRFIEEPLICFVIRFTALRDS